jgi:hypothetical protein
MKYITCLYAVLAFSCMSVKPFPEVVQGDFQISELDKDKNLIKCTNDYATINRVENRSGSKLYFNYNSNSLKINIPEAKWVGGNAYEGIDKVTGEKYVVTMMHYKEPYLFAIEMSPDKFVLVGFKCWREQTIALN